MWQGNHIIWGVVADQARYLGNIHTQMAAHGHNWIGDDERRERDITRSKASGAGGVAPSRLYAQFCSRFGGRREPLGHGSRARHLEGYLPYG